MLGQLSFDFDTAGYKLKDKLQVAIKRAKFFEPIALRTGGYYLCYSGGKDSIASKIVLDLAGVKYTSNYNMTGIDPPEVVYFIRKQNVIMHQHNEDFFSLVLRKLLPPTRAVRYCCPELKEHGGDGRFCVTGVRWEESDRRRKTRKPVEFDNYGSKSKKAIQLREKFYMSDNDERRKIMETETTPNGCRITGKHTLNVVVDFTAEDVWELIRYYNAEYPYLYDEGFKRLGCIGCPKTSKCNRIREFNRWPKFKENYIRLFDRLLIKRAEIGKKDTWKSGEEIFQWWLNG